LELFLSWDYSSLFNLFYNIDSYKSALIPIVIFLL